MKIDQITSRLLANRGLKTKKQIAEFFHPIPPAEIPSPFVSAPAIKLIRSHIKKGHKIAVYGDYDVDGLCSTAILWETLYSHYPNVFPHIPHRELEGYGLSLKGIDHCLEQQAKLIITVDNGIVAHQQVDYCRSQKCDLIIIDHHQADDHLPKANCVLHSTSNCAAGLTWFFCRDYLLAPNSELLSLVAIATICDIVPLLGTNRSFAKSGLEELNKTTRPGLLSLFEEAQLPSPRLVTPYHVGFIIGPRLNATGRLEHAIDSLRLLCTKDPKRAHELAKTLGETNRARQQATQQSVAHALDLISMNSGLSTLIIAADTSYHQGIIGLIAAKIVEKYYRPAIVISIGRTESKASARSIPGFHITDHIRTASHLLLNIGGHAMAAGFTVENSKLETLISKLTDIKINPQLLVKTQRIDLEVPLSTMNYELITRLKAFEPYGLGNPTPIFMSKNIQISDVRKLGKLGQHLKFKAGNLEAVWFNVPSPSLELREGLGVSYDLTYQIEENTWNGQSKLQLVIKEVKSIHG